MMFKFMLALAATLAALQVPVPNGNGGGTGWQAVKGGTICTSTRRPDGRTVTRCEKR